MRVIFERVYKVSDVEIVKEVSKKTKLFKSEQFECWMENLTEEYKTGDTIKLLFKDIKNKVWFTHKEINNAITETFETDLLAYYETHQTYTDTYDTCMKDSNDKGYCYNQALDNMGEYMGTLFNEVFTKEYVEKFLENKTKYLINIVDSYSKELKLYTNKRKAKDIKDKGEEIETVTADEIVDSEVPEEVSTEEETLPNESPSEETENESTDDTSEIITNF